MKKERGRPKVYKERTQQEIWKANKLKNRYGISFEEFNEMFSKQSGCCAICKTHQSEYKRALHVDHCHSTGVVRGLICHGCNLGLGGFKDNVESLKTAIEYLGKNIISHGS